VNTRQQQLTGTDRWQISYADLLTLLLGFFIVMYAVSSMEAEKKQAIISALHKEFSSANKQTGLLATEPTAIAPRSPASGDISFLADSSFVIEAQGEWLFLEVASEAFFASGSAVLMPSAKKDLNSLAHWLNTSDGLVEIEGHTDNQPINTPEFANNWALSSARAVAIINYLTTEHGLSGTRFRAVGYGEYAPIADNATPEGRRDNRRVVVKVENKPLPLAPMNTISNTSSAPLNSFIAEAEPDRQINSDISATTDQATTNIESLEERLKAKGINPEELPGGGLKFTGEP
jgi:chemotaxis protein MotB